MKKRISLDEAIAFFGTQNDTLIIPILSNSQYLNFEIKSRSIDDINKRIDYHNSLFYPNGIKNI